jgi:hypothetical protein
MPRDGAIIFRDLIGKLGVLRVERGTSAIRLTADIGAIIVDVAEVPLSDSCTAARSTYSIPYRQ